MSRHRVRSIPHTTDVHFPTRSHGMATAGQSYKFGVQSEEDLTDDVSIGGFIANPCHHIHSEAGIYRKRTHAFQVNDTESSWMDVERLAMALNVAPALPTEIDWGEILSTFADQVEDVLRTRSMLAVTILEAAKTWGMITNPFSLLKGNWRSLAQKHSASELAKRGTSVWLESRYGWRPFYGDLKSFCSSSRSLMQSLSESEDKQASGRRISSRNTLFNTVPAPSMSETVWSETCATEDYWSSDQGHISRVVYTSDRATATLSGLDVGAVQYSYSPLQRAMQAFGVSPADLLPTLWEVVPYSFVIDWFVNSKGIWSNLNAGRISRAHLQRLCYTVKRTTEFYGETTFGRPWDFPGFRRWYWPTYSKSMGGFISTFSRTPGLPAAESLFLSKGLSTLHTADLGSLILQRLL